MSATNNDHTTMFSSMDGENLCILSLQEGQKAIIKDIDTLCMCFHCPCKKKEGTESDEKLEVSCNRGYYSCIRNYLLSMGVFPGSMVEVESKSKGNIVLKVKQSRIALRFKETLCLKVDLL